MKAKRLLAIVLTLCMLLGTTAFSALAEETNTTISSLEDFVAFRDAVNGGNTYAGQTITLAADIDLSTIADWTPIGNGERSGSGYTGNSFSGIFDGGNKTISNLTISSGESSDAIGLFGVVNGGTVKNLTLTDVNINASSNKNAGAAIGLMVGGATADSIAVSGLVSAADGVGGVIGRMTISGTVSNCVNSANVSGAAAGGIVGKAYYTGEGVEMNISGSSNSGTITGTAEGGAGGIVGFSATNVSNCTNSGTITSTAGGVNLGGIVGWQQMYGEISGNTNNGSVTSDYVVTTAGGIVGWANYQYKTDGTAPEYPVCEVISVTGNTNNASIIAANSSLGSGGIVGGAYNAVSVTGNTNYADTITGKAFAAGILGNYQAQEGNGYNGDAKTLTVTDNTTYTKIENITANCVNVVCYDNVFYRERDYTATNTVITETPVASVNGVPFTDIQEAIKEAAPSGTVDIISDITVDEWKMFAENMTSGSGIPVKLNINGMTINGNNHTLNVNSIVSANNGNMLFYDAQELNINNLTINAPNGIGLQAGTIENVTFNGGERAIYPAGNGVIIKNCKFNNQNGIPVYYEPKNNITSLTVDGCTFNCPGINAINLYGGETFTNNQIVASRGVTVASGSATISGNVFAEDVRIKVYNVATATITGNTLTKIVFEDESEVQSTFTDNTLSASAQETLEQYGVIKTVTNVVEVNGVGFETLESALAAATAGAEIVLLADVEGGINVPADVTFNGNGFDVTGKLYALGDITFAGHTKIATFDFENVGTEINIGVGACLELTDTANRMVIGHGCTFNIEGNITDAKTANVAELTPSLIMPGASFTGAGVTFNVKNAYIKTTAQYCSSSKSASGTFDFNIENSIWEQFGKLAFESQSTAATVNFDLKDSVLTTTSHLVFGVSRGEIVIDNSNVNVGTSRQIENQSTMTIKNGSVVNGAVATSSNAKNPGTIIVEDATYAVTGEFSGSDLGIGTIILNKDATFSAGSITKANITIDAAGLTAGQIDMITADLSKFAGEISVINNTLGAKIENGKIVLVVKPVAKIGDVEYTSLAEALEAAVDGDTITLIADCASVDLTVNNAVTIDLGGKTITDAYIIIKKAVEIKNGDIVNTNEPYPLVVKGGHLTVNDVDIAASKSDRAVWLDGGTLDFNSGSILATKGEGNSKGSIAAIWVSSGQVNINGGTLTVDTPGADAIGVYGNYANAHVTMNGGKISTSGDSYSYGIRVDGDITVTDGEIVTNEKGYGYSSGIRYGNNYALYTCLGDVTVTGGKITTNGYSGYMVNVGRTYSSVDQTITISGVEFTNSLNEVEQTKGGHKAPVLICEGSASNVTATITSGTFNGVSSTLTRGDNITLTVSGGTFGNAPNEKYLADGYVITENADGTYGVAEYVPALAKIGDAEYASVADALKAAQEAGIRDLTITLIGETTRESALAAEDSFDLIYSTGFDNVTIKQEDPSKVYYIDTIYTGDRTSADGKFVFDGVNIEITSQIWFECPVVLKNNSTITRYQDVKNFIYYGDVTIEPGSKFNSVIDDVFAGSITVDGGITDGTYSEAPGYRTTYLDVRAGHTLTLKNGAYGLFNAANEVGRLTLYGNAYVSDSKLEVYNDIIINDNGLLDIDCGSTVSAKVITGAGTISVDASSFNGTDVQVITANMSGFTGTIEITGNDNVTYEMTDSGLVITSVPAVAKIGDDTYTSLQAAVDAAENGATIIVIDDIELTETVTIAADDVIILDLNGKTVSMIYAEDASANHTMIRNWGNLTIQDSATDGKLSYKYTGANLGTANSANTITTDYGSVLTVKSGTIENLTYDSATIAYAIDGLTNGNGGDVTINIEGGTITSLRQAVRIFANSTTKTGTLNISNGNITGRVIVQNANTKANKAALNISGGTFNTNAYKTEVLYVGGTNGATIDMAPSITDGTFNGEISSTMTTKFITGGTFATDVTEFLADGYALTENADGTFGVVKAPVAQIGDDTFTSLQDAINAATAGDTITVINNIDITETVTIAADDVITLDLNGKNITVANDSINLQINGTLTVEDNVGGSVSTFRNHMVMNGGMLTLNNGTLQNVETATAGFGVYVDANGQFVMNGGTVKAVNESNYAIRIQPNATATINNGTVSGNWGAINTSGILTINNGTFNVTDGIGGHSVYVGAGSTTINNGDFNPFNKNTTASSYSAYVAANATLVVKGGSFESTVYGQFACSGDEGAQIDIAGGTFDTEVPEKYLADGYTAIKELTNGNYVVGEAPTATVNNLGAMTIAGGTYMSLGGGSTSEDMELNFVMQFLADQDAEDMETSPYADWYGDFVITFTGIENGSFIADNCYLAGYYGDFGWVKVPVDGMKVENGARYPVMLGYGAGQKYDYICESVKDFRCAMYLTPEILAANPNLKVNLELSVVDNSAGSDAATNALMEGKEGTFYKTGSTEYTVEDFATPVAKIGEDTYTSLQEAVNAAVNGDIITVLEDIDLSGTTVTIPAGVEMTLDLNGKTISDVCNASQGHMIMVAHGADLTIKDSSAEQNGKITYASGTSNVGWTIDVEGDLVLESGTIELTGSWSIGYAVDVRPNAWGTAYTVPTTFVMNGGNIVSSDGAVRVASSSSDIYPNVSASFTMNDGKIDAAWDGVFVQQSNAAWDTLNFTINGGTIESDLNPVRFYGPAATSYVSGEDCVNIALNGGTLTYTGAEEQTWLVENILRIGGGVTVEDFMKDSAVTASAIFAESNVTEGYEWVESNGVYTLEKETVTELFNFTNFSVSLDSSLALNIYLNSSDLTGEDYYAVVNHTKADGTVATTNIPYTEWVTSGNSKTIRYTGIAAKEMADIIEITVYKADGTQASTAYKTSLKDYAMYMLNLGSQENSPYSSWLPVLIDMLNYGAAAQKIFGYNTDNLANAEADDFQQHASEMPELSNEGCMATDPNSFGTVTLENMIKLNVYFGNVTEDMYATYSYTTHAGTSVEGTVEYDSFVSGWGKLGVPVDVAIADAATLVTVTMFNGDDEVVGSVVYSVNAYLKNKIDSNTPDEIYPALAKFAASAKAAFAK